MDILLVRYAEMGLKSRPVRQRFQEILKENIMEALAQKGEEALIASDQGRIYVRPTAVQSALGPVSRVFGVASVSPAMETSGDMEDIVTTAAHFSREVLSRGQRFAIRARREGSHPFTSMEVAREAGAEVLSHNLDREVSVDLSSPDVEIFIEVRENRAFVFDRYVQGPGGLPMGSQGRVVAVVRGERDLLAAWLMMKRGCQVAVFSTDRRWAPLDR
ncbi:MAG: THUMP domain-containing protein, partial [Methanomassiliicoccales archaeon]